MKGVLGFITKACLEKIVKKQSMHASEPTPVHIVKGNNFENSSVTRTEMRLIKWIWIHMLQLLEAWWVHNYDITV